MARIEESATHVTERPDFAKHVLATWERRRADESGEVLPQRIELRCDRCEATHLVICQSGQVRRHIHAFGVAHLHADPLPR